MIAEKAREVLANQLEEPATLHGARLVGVSESIAAMQAYARQARLAALDEAAKVARDIDVDALSAHAAQEAIATAIEALKEQP